MRCRHRRILKAAANALHRRNDIGLSKVILEIQEIVGMQKLDIVLLKRCLGKVAQIERDDGIAIAVYGGSEYMPIIGVRQCQARYQLGIVGYHGVKYCIVRQGGSPPQFAFIWVRPIGDQ